MVEQAISLMPSSLTLDLLRRVCTQQEVAQASDIKQEEGMLDDLFIGVDQPRFEQALQLGLHESSKNHIFIAGLSGPRALSGVQAFVNNFLKNSTKKTAETKDWCYIHNFDDPLEPIVISLNRGRGTALKQRMEKLLSELQERIPAALVEDEIVAQRQSITLSMGMWWESERFRIVQEAREEGMWISFEGKYAPSAGLISRTKREIEREGRIITPMMDTKELQSLSSDERGERIAVRDKWIHRLNMVQVEYERRLREMQEAVIKLNRRIVGETVDSTFAHVRLTSSERAASYAQKLKNFTIDNFGIFNQSNEQGPPPPHHKPFLPWAINVMVDNSAQDISPVVVDYDGTFENLVGNIRRVAGSGNILYTDHTMILAGSLARANNGYLIVDAMNILRNTGSYPMLKRVLSNEVLKIEDIMSFYGMGSIVPLQPMPIPLNVKVIMVGSHYLWSMLAHYDPEFMDHFELKAEVAQEVDWTAQETSALANATRQYAKNSKLLPFQDDALQRIVEHAGRLADTQTKLSTDFRQLEPIVREASYLAAQENAKGVSALHVRNAIERKFYRSDLRYQRMQSMIRDKKIILPLKGEAVGQMTILSVGNLGDIQVGFPGRLTCEWSMGRPGFVSIQREAKLAGNILTKGELTVQKCLESLFAKKYPLAVNISYSVEQTYGKVDGDSASLALFYCIISALADMPIRQDVAITGSLSQRREPQPIGGANEKIEGFFESCFITGLTGTQGVIIPASNAKDLMLNDRILDGVRDGTFHIWAINSVDEGMRILMGREAGERKPDFTFTENSVYNLVDKRLRDIAISARRFFKNEEDDLFV